MWRAGSTVERLGALAFLAEDLSLIPSTYVGQCTIIRNSSFKRSDTLAPIGTCIHMVYMKGQKIFHFWAGPFWDSELHPSPQDKLKVVGPLFRGHKFAYCSLFPYQ